jgi:hypothetical protein
MFELILLVVGSAFIGIGTGEVLLSCGIFLIGYSVLYVVRKAEVAAIYAQYGSSSNKATKE